MIDIFLENQIILITLGLAALPLVAALMLVVIPRVRQKMAQIKQARVQARLEKQQLAAAYKKAQAKQVQTGRKSRRPASSMGVPEDDDEYGDDEEGYQSQAKPESTSVSARKRRASLEARQEEPDAGTEEDEESDDDEEESSEDGEVSTEMLSLLSDVFVDEEANARMEVLLSNTVEIEATNLLELCNKVADKLGSRSQVAQ